MRGVDKTLRKARRGQTTSVPADAGVLVVYLMGTNIAEDLTHSVHVKQAESVLDDLDPTDYGLDAITFVVRAQPTSLAAVLTVVDDTTLTVAQVKTMFMTAP
jgi:hypothetical protein